MLSSGCSQIEKLCSQNEKPKQPKQPKQVIRYQNCYDNPYLPIADSTIDYIKVRIPLCMLLLLHNILQAFYHNNFWHRLKNSKHDVKKSKSIKRRFS